MAEQKLTAEKREGTGKGVARKLRAGGRVPAVLYGHGMEPLSLSVNARELNHVLHTGAGTNVLVDLLVDGTEHLTLPREIQRNYIRNQLLHVDFLAVSRTETIAVDVPVREVGESPGIKAGGVVEHHLFEVHVECLPTDVPEVIEADISELELGDALRVDDLTPPKGVTILTNPEDSVLAVVVPAVLKTEAELLTPEEEALAAQQAAEAAEAAAAAASEEEEEEGAAPAEGEEAPGAPATPAEEGGEG
jgi:large subunit ribosomal protein L25